jgi:hypothetical protein
VVAEREGGSARAGGRERESRCRRGRGEGEISLGLFFLNCNDYIAPLLIVLGRLAS